MNATKTWTSQLFWNTFPVIVVHLTCLLFWSGYLDVDLTSLSLFETIFTMLILPIYLLIANNSTSDKLSVRAKLRALTYMALSICLSTLFHYSIWANTVGNWRSPDHETWGLIQLEFAVGLLIVGVVTTLSSLQRRT